MRRRDLLLTTLVIPFLPAPAPAQGPPPADTQPSNRTFRIGVLANLDTPNMDGLRQGLRERGYVDGSNVTVEWRWSEGKTERLPALAIELVGTQPDVIVASGTQAVRAAKEATGTIPIVMVAAGYPEKTGLVESLARPGGNITGLSSISPELYGKRLGLLKEIVPEVSRILLLYNPASPIEQQIGMPAVVAAASAVGLAIQPVEVRTPEEFPKAIAAVNLERTDGLVVSGNPVNWRNRQAIAEFALTKRLPSIGEERQFVESGVLVSYGTNYTELFRRSATFVDKILKGAKPADLPVELPTTFDMVINLKAAKALDITIPASVIARADEVIE